MERVLPGVMLVFAFLVGGGYLYDYSPLAGIILAVSYVSIGGILYLYATGLKTDSTTLIIMGVAWGLVWPILIALLLDEVKESKK